ncbi:transporter substrate-binding domain-containing protein [Pseudomonas resinovorans]|uniref:Transporter substrate-binding domain-containing protein n=1 Tax=Metapseudomonas resinovorans TaxID=53412 RepID=A0ABT4YCU9_METRE|nr:transporter substrate-binding domain-containing protein [Pseudomonas resinovorans]MDA8486437.1 transporter substrate-binding domain-containing protein [Pseudomonas resinovorans]
MEVGRGHSLKALCFSLVLLVSAPVAASQTVQVAGAHFPPYVVKPESAEASGLLLDMLAALNALQTDYRFVVRPTAIPRRFRDFQEGRIDLAVFENPDWGWQGIPGARIDMGLEDAEIFVAKAQPGRSQHYFGKLAGKRLALYSGYHYGFAGFNPDPAFLQREFDAKLTYSHDSNLRMLLRERADIALVTRSYFNAYLERNPEQAGTFLASDRIDQSYHHYALLRPGAPISAEQFSALLERLRTGGQLQQIFGRYGVLVRPAAAGSSAASDGKH